MGQMNRKGETPPVKQVKSAQRFAYCLALSALVMTLCTKSSFLYPMNDWVDANIYFTIGKGMMRGLVPYRDLFDQKGPVVFLLYGLCTLVSDTSFLGVYLAEVLSFSCFLYFSGKTVNLFVRRGGYLLLPLLAAAVGCGLAFSHGGSLEEFCLAPFSFTLFCSLRYFHEDYPRPVSVKVILINGFLAGLVLMSKFNLLAFYFAFMALIAIAQLMQKRVKGFFGCCLLFLGMMAVPFLLWTGYFAVVGALPEFFQSYFIGNLFGYSYLEEPVLLNMLLAILRGTAATLWRNLPYGLFLLLGYGWFTLKKNAMKGVEKINLWAFLLLTCCGVYCGGQGYRYYGLVLAVFAPLGFVSVLRWLSAKWPGVSDKPALPAAALSALALCACLLFSGNGYLRGMPREDTPQYRFAGVMEARSGGKDFTLLCRAFPDSGFYLAADVLPNLRFFTSTNVPMPEAGQAQQAYLDAGLADYVVTRDRMEPPEEGLVLLDTASLYYEEAVSTYRLYGKPGQS